VNWENLQRLLKEAKINAYLAAPSHQANVLGQYIYGEAQLSAFFRELREAF
jgi:plasmid segregation protein ParM